jgi:hypothetical protein
MEAPLLRLLLHKHLQSQQQQQKARLQQLCRQLQVPWCHSCQLARVQPVGWPAAGAPLHLLL